MLFMTCGNAGPTFTAMLAHQYLFGRFVGPARPPTDLGQWDTWVGDNGAFTGFDQEAFMRYVKGLLSHKSTCKCLTVPDVPFHWEPTLIKFKDWSPSLRRMGFPIGLAVQDGATVDNIPWNEIDALFIGGSTEWKRQLSRTVGDEMPLFTGKPLQVERPTEVKAIVDHAKQRGIWVHIGRSGNAPKQLWYAHQLGADSVDGTRQVFAPNKEFKWISQTMWDINCR